MSRPMCTGFSIVLLLLRVENGAWLSGKFEFFFYIVVMVEQQCSVDGLLLMTKGLSEDISTDLPGPVARERERERERESSKQALERSVH